MATTPAGCPDASSIFYRDGGSETVIISFQATVVIAYFYTKIVVSVSCN